MAVCSLASAKSLSIVSMVEGNVGPSWNVGRAIHLIALTQVVHMCDASCNGASTMIGEPRQQRSTRGLSCCITAQSGLATTTYASSTRRHKSAPANAMMSRNSQKSRMQHYRRCDMYGTVKCDMQSCPVYPSHASCIAVYSHV